MELAYFTVLLSFVFMASLVDAKFEKDPDFIPRSRDVSYSSDGSEQWAYADIRTDAHLFWWLYYSTNSDGYENRPLVIWLQGGPGGSSCGYGNFEIIGPLDLGLQPRNSTWVQSANVLFIDQPVGTGYSYVDSASAYTRDVDEIADDLMTLLNVFYQENAEFQSSPLYIFGQSYGGKMGVVLAQYIYDAVASGDLTANLAGIAMGNSWLDPVGSTLSWAPFLYSMSAVDEYALAAIQSVALQAKQAADEGRWVDSTDLWAYTEQVLWSFTNYIDFYNILNYETFGAYDRTFRNDQFGHKYDLALGSMDTFELDTLMNGPIKYKLGIIPDDVTWGGQSSLVFYYQEGDFMKDVLSNIDYMINTTDVDVIIYQGQLDLICDTKAALDLVFKLEWEGVPDFMKAERIALTDPETQQTDLYFKEYENFQFYWNLRAGHAVPADMPGAALRMLKRIIADSVN